jgi:hypothetical protein
MTDINYVHDFLERLRSPSSNEEPPLTPHVSNHVIELAEKINAWHDARPVPERWQPVQLGRLAALFNVSRELTAVALGYAGWVEKKRSAQSLWHPK